MKWLIQKWIWISAGWISVTWMTGVHAGPNVVLIFTDDQGYADVGCYGAEGFETPALDRMAAEGVRFTDFYAANSVCSPSRAALLTGRYPTRCGVPEVLGPDAGKYLKGYPLGLPESEITMAEILKQAGYATACIGKWHLGHTQAFLPTRQGFDTYFGIPYSNDMPIDPEAPLADDILLRRGATIEGIRAGAYAKATTNPSGDLRAPSAEFYTPLMRGEEVIEFPVDQTTLTRRYTDEALSFIREHRDQPFFVYLAHTMPHVPLAATELFRGKSEAGRYGDVMQELDANVGRLIATLDELGLRENTLVIFTSDNGPWAGLGDCSGSARPFKGAKFQTHEGGQRVPMIVWGPEWLPPGRVCKRMASTLDLLPTVAELAGVPLPEDRVIDGQSLVPLLSGEGEADWPERTFCYLRGWEVQALRKGHWKVQLATVENFYRLKKSDNNPGFLYDLKGDPGETTDLSATYPELFRELRALALEQNAELGERMRERMLGENHE